MSFKVVIVGRSGVGKTAYLRRLAENTYDSQFGATIGVDFVD